MGAKIPTDYPQIFWRISLGILSINKPKVHCDYSIMNWKGRIFSGHIFMNNSPYWSPVCILMHKNFFTEILILQNTLHFNVNSGFKLHSGQVLCWRTGSESLHQILRLLHDVGLFLPNPSYLTRTAFAAHTDGRAGLCCLSPLSSLAACLSPKRFKSLRLSKWPSWSPAGIC